MSSGKLVSVIVPVYNAVNTLERCINSILRQTYHNLEIIMVDDASTDSSRELMLKLEQTDPERIMVICNDVNHGAGGARNIALEYARGDYLAFVDSDDYIHSSFVELLVAEMEKGGHDFVDCGYFDERKDRAILHTDRNMRGILSDDTKCNMIAVGGYLCTKLFRRELFYDHNVRFREKCILEDSEIMVEMIAYAKSVGAVEETMYWYTASPSSTSNGQAAASYVKNIYEAMSAFVGLKEKLENYEALRPAIEYIMIQMYDYGVHKVLSDLQRDHVMDSFRELNKLRYLRLENITEGYNNKHILARIKKAELDVMALNDKDPQKLINKYK
ncbi:MAG: glycosyltransferase family 2 protein [Lachnospiraceae bacterium]|nr:glycosyltransferase family 2 protein [Lachnospiraceae bacterium]